MREFTGKYKFLDFGALAPMTAVIAGLVGKRLLYSDLIADNGLPLWSAFLGRRESGAKCSGTALP